MLPLLITGGALSLLLGSAYCVGKKLEKEGKLHIISTRYKTYEDARATGCKFQRVTRANVTIAKTTKGFSKGKYFVIVPEYATINATYASRIPEHDVVEQLWLFTGFRHPAMGHMIEHLPKVLVTEFYNRHVDLGTVINYTDLSPHLESADDVAKDVLKMVQDAGMSIESFMELGTTNDTYTKIAILENMAREYKQAVARQANQMINTDGTAAETQNTKAPQKRRTTVTPKKEQADETVPAN